MQDQAMARSIFWAAKYLLYLFNLVDVKNEVLHNLLLHNNLSHIYCSK